jgi:ABC-type uncharacterized transport system involved in gliding motility auxiliary subunit
MLVAANILAGRYPSARLDLTAEGFHTLSPATRQVLSRIDEPIALGLYYSPRLGDAGPVFAAYARRVRYLLDQYVAEAHGKVQLEIYRPEVSSDDEEQASAFGLTGVAVDGQQKRAYFGLVGINAIDEQRVIGFFDPERDRFLEYDLTRLVQALASASDREDLAALRSRSASQRPFELIQRIRRDAEQNHAAKQQALERKLQEREQELRALTAGQMAETKSAPTTEQVRAIERLRADIAGARRQLRELTTAAPQEIQQLKAMLEFIDIVLVPMLVALVAIVLTAARRRRWRRSATA